MKYIRTHWPLAAIILAFLAGNFLGNSSSDKELEKKFQQERQRDREAIKHLQTLDALKSAEYDQKINCLVKDTTEKGIELRGYKRSTAHFKKLYEKINLQTASEPELDSLRALLRSKSLHPPR